MADAQEIERLSPDKLMAGFSASRIWSGLLISVIVHVVLIGGTSLTYIYGRIDPKWAAAREAAMKKEAEAGRASEAGQPPAAGTSKPDDGASPAAPEEAKPEAAPAGGQTKPDAGAPDKKMTEDERLMKERADTPVVKAITETAKPEEIPETPSLGIGIDETNLE